MIIKVNGKEHDVQVNPDTSLLTVLREHLGLTGTRYGCGEGQCAACTVLVNDKAEHSCIRPVGTVADAEVTTIEGLAKEGKLHPVQQAFLEEDAFQCSYCASGMVLGAVSLLKENPSPSEEDIVANMQGHICRCGTYPFIIKAIQRAAALK